MIPFVYQLWDDVIIDRTGKWFSGAKDGRGGHGFKGVAPGSFMVMIQINMWIVVEATPGCTKVTKPVQSYSVLFAWHQASGIVSNSNRFSASQTLTGCSMIHLYSDTSYLEFMYIPQNCPHFRSQSQVPCSQITSASAWPTTHLEIPMIPVPQIWLLVRIVHLTQENT